MYWLILITGAKIRVIIRTDKHLCEKVAFYCTFLEFVC